MSAKSVKGKMANGAKAPQITRADLRRGSLKNTGGVTAFVTPRVYFGRMKNAHLFPDQADSGEVIALFGDAKLVKTIDSKYELRGGSKGDRTAAQKWVSMFMHEMVLTFQTK